MNSMDLQQSTDAMLVAGMIERRLGASAS